VRTLLFALFLAVSTALTPAHAQEWTQALPDVAALQAEPAPTPPEDWITIEGLNLYAHANGRDRHTLEQLVKAADESIPAIAMQLGVPMGAKMHLYLADSQEGFHTMQPGRAPDWADGTAWPHRGLIYLRSPRIRPGTSSPLTQVLDHEIVHILLGRAFAPQPVPRWLQEGMAQWVSGEYDPQVIEKLAKGLATGGLITLDDLTTGFPANPVRANLAYAQSADLIVYIVGEYGEDALQQIVHDMAAGKPVRAAFRHAIGEDPDELDAAWRSGLESSGVWLQVFTDASIWWGIAALLAVVAGVSVRRRNKVKLDRWEREEAMHDALLQSLHPRSVEPPEIPTDIPSDVRWPDSSNDWVH